MKYILSLITLALAVNAYALEPGTVSPDFTLPDLQTKAVKMSDYKGKYVYLDFWASWCGPCKHSIPWMNKLKSRFGADKFEVVAINLDDSDESVNKFLKGHDINFKILRDPEGKTPISYEVGSMPTSFLIDPEGKVKYVHPGFCESEEGDIEKVIEQELKSSKNSA